MVRLPHSSFQSLLVIKMSPYHRQMWPYRYHRCRWYWCLWVHNYMRWYLNGFKSILSVIYKLHGQMVLLILNALIYLTIMSCSYFAFCNSPAAYSHISLWFSAEMTTAAQSVCGANGDDIRLQLAIPGCSWCTISYGWHGGGLYPAVRCVWPSARGPSDTNRACEQKCLY